MNFREKKNVVYVSVRCQMEIDVYKLSSEFFNIIDNTIITVLDKIGNVVIMLSSILSVQNNISDTSIILSSILNSKAM